MAIFCTRVMLFHVFLWNLGALHRLVGGHEIDHFEVVQQGIIFNWSPYSNSSLFGQIGPKSKLTILFLVHFWFMSSKSLISYSVFNYFWNLGQSWCSKILISCKVFHYFRKSWFQECQTCIGFQMFFERVHSFERANSTYYARFFIVIGLRSLQTLL